MGDCNSKRVAVSPFSRAPVLLPLHVAFRFSSLPVGLSRFARVPPWGAVRFEYFIQILAENSKSNLPAMFIIATRRAPRRRIRPGCALPVFLERAVSRHRSGNLKRPAGGRRRLGDVGAARPSCPGCSPGGSCESRRFAETLVHDRRPAADLILCLGEPVLYHIA
jgi:hypothetical protein